MARYARTPALFIGLLAAAAVGWNIYKGPEKDLPPTLRPRLAAAAILPEIIQPAPAKPVTMGETRPAAAPLKATPPDQRADRNLTERYRAPTAGGLMTFPKTFASEDGRYNVVLHLNGNTDLVEESFSYAGVNAIVVIFNLGRGSGVYEDKFDKPTAFTQVLDRVQEVLVERGLENPRLDRVAVSGWSSGYGGVSMLLKRPEFFDKIDGVMLLDSIYCGYELGSKKLRRDQMDPMERFAQRAMRGDAVLTVTHSEIEVIDYVNSRDTTNALLGAVGVARRDGGPTQPIPPLVSMEGVLPKAQIVSLPPLSEAHQGDFHVRGYSGNGPATHMLHLMQMATIALPDLVAYWSRPKG